MSNPFFGKAPDLSIIHISDLHFVDSLTERGRRVWGKLGVNSHSFARADALSREIYKIRRLRDAVGTESILLVTGDISTSGDKESLQTAKAFLESEEMHEQGRLVTYGLGFRADRRVVVAGNHDRYGSVPLIQRASNTSFEETFGSPSRYPYLVAHAHGSSGRSIVFFVFDSTLIRPGDEFLWNRVARGRIEDAECDWLRNETKKLAAGTQLQSLDFKSRVVIDPSRCIKVAVLHHHPVGAGSGTSTMLINNENFASACRDSGMDYVLFGHEHTFYRVSQPHTTKLGTAHYLCAPSATQFKGAAGFLTFDYFSGECVITHYAWKDEEARFIGQSVQLGKRTVKRVTSRRNMAAPG
jgi:3',5'-cyclic AMP phosphodiesterase CpdA